MYHRVNIEPEILRCIFGMKSAISHLKLLHVAYIRAFLYSSNVITFEAERMHIE